MEDGKDPYSDLLVDFKELLDEAANPQKSFLEDDFDFYQIARVRAEIGHIDERIESRKIKRVKKRNALVRREELASRLAGLEAGHELIARKLKIKAQSLGALPREMRDAIYGQMYRSETPISPRISHFGSKTIFRMPKDSGLYMSQRHVGPVIAEEAAETFYTQNIFEFGWEDLDTEDYNRNWDDRVLNKSTLWSHEMYDLFLDCDHYESGVVPRELIRKICIIVPNTGRSNYACAFRFEYHARDDHPRQITFERELSQWLENSWGGSLRCDERRHLEYFLDFEGLQEFVIVITVDDGNYDSVCRLINPIVRSMMDRRVKTKVLNRPASRQDEVQNTKVIEQDISCFFESPRPEDYTRFLEKYPDPLFTFDEKADPLEAWWSWTRTNDEDIVNSIYSVDTANIVDEPDVPPRLPEAGLIRAWLHEAHEVYRFYQKHRVVIDKLNEMWEELKSFDTEELAMRKRYYGRMMELMTQKR